MRPRITPSALALALVAGFVAACAQGDSSQAPALPEGAARVQAGTKIALADGLLEVPHAGLRKVEVYDRSDDIETYLAFRERVVTDGQGRYSIEPVEPLTEVAPNWSSFQLLQRLREGYVFRYRDFAIRHEGLFHQNYVLYDLGEETRVAGRRCGRYRAQRNSDGKVYELSVDRETGMVLAYEELASNGDLLSAMEYETYQVAPDTSDVRWHTSINQEEELDWSWDLSVQLGVHTDTPRVVPDGYALREASRVVDGDGEPWLKLAYFDGVEPLFFLVTLPEPGETSRGAQAIDVRSAIAPGTVSVFQLGAARAAQATMGDYRFIALGKVPDSVLLDMIESALP